MMRLQTYTGFSLISTLAVIYHAFNSRRQFYPSMVYLSTSKISLVLLLNMGLVIMCILWQLIKRVFLGSLREAEVDRLNEQSRREIVEILFALTIFRLDFSVTFLAMVSTLLLIKALHWLAQKRVEYIETTPTVPMLAHIRMVSFMSFLLLVDCLFLYSSIRFLIQTRQASVSLLFSFEYMILATTTLSIFIKYVFYVSDMLMEGQWEKKAVYTFYLELIRDLLHLSLYMCFFLAIFMNYGVPLHLIREFYETFRNFRIRIADYIRYQKITSNMNDRFPDATTEELDASDSTCIICREEMTMAKKLICGHLFHVHCLRSWLERQHTCPTCRALVVPPENGTSAAGVQHGQGPDARQSGIGTASASAQGSVDGVTDNSLNRHQARLQEAAVAAASVYGKSYVYPSPNTLVWSPGYVVLPQSNRPLGDSSDMESGEEQAYAGQPEVNPGGPTTLSFPQFPPSVFVPFQMPGNLTYGERLWSTQKTPISQFEAQKKSIDYQIQILENQLQLLQKFKPEGTEETNSTTSSDGEGKTAASFSFSASYCGHHGEKEEVTS